MKNSECHNERISEACTGRTYSEETINIWKKQRKGKIISKETRKKMSESKKGIIPSDITIQKSIEKNGIAVIIDGEFFFSRGQAAKKLNVTHHTIGNRVKSNNFLEYRDATQEEIEEYKIREDIE